MQQEMFDNYRHGKNMRWTPDQKTLALSWKNPYGELMLPPFDKDETRVWNTSYRGWVLICTSKKPYDESSVIGISGEENAQRIFTSLNSRGTVERNGMAIGIGLLIGSRPMTHSDEKKTYVKCYLDLYVHTYINVKPIVPFAWKGSQGWREVPMEIKKQILFITNGMF